MAMEIIPGPNLVVATPAVGDSSHKPASTEFVNNAIASANVPVAATQTDQEAATSTAVFVSPGRQQFHPSAAKAWAQYTYVTGTPTVNGTAYNVSSFTDNATGDATINFLLPFSSTSYVFSGSSMVATGTVGFLWGPFTSVPTTSAFRVIAATYAGASSDNVFNSVVFFGDLP